MDEKEKKPRTVKELTGIAAAVEESLAEQNLTVDEMIFVSSLLYSSAVANVVAKGIVSMMKNIPGAKVIAVPIHNDN